ncbi:hypothetical protein Tco_0158560 [Tanacetum coccineum]
MWNSKGVKVFEKQSVNLSPKTYNEPSSCRFLRSQNRVSFLKISSPAEVQLCKIRDGTDPIQYIVIYIRMIGNSVSRFKSGEFNVETPIRDELHINEAMETRASATLKCATQADIRRYMHLGSASQDCRRNFSQRNTIATTSVTTAAVTRPKAKGIVFHDQEEQVSVSKPTVSSTQPSIKDKGKAIMIESERPLKNKDQVAADEELARQLDGEMQAKIAEEERIKRQKEEEANIALIES